jgi:hypothetical protein
MMALLFRLIVTSMLVVLKTRLEAEPKRGRRLVCFPSVLFIQSIQWTNGTKESYSTLGAQ